MRRHARRLGLAPSGRQPRPDVAVLPLPPLLMAERDSHRSAILGVLKTLVARLGHTAAQVKLDFSPVKRIYPGGMLMLLAYLEMLTEESPNRIRAACPPGSMAAQLINHFGFGQRLRVPSAGNTPQHHSVINWRFATGRQADGGKIAVHIQSFADMVGSSMPGGLYNALTEAMTNVRHHAYPDSAGIPESLQRWWLFSQCRPPTAAAPGQLYLAFYDIGVGIPASMRTRLETLREQLREGFDALMASLGLNTTGEQDGRLLRLAIDEPRTSTGLPFRGKGLPEMKEFAASTLGGRMTIVSGRAQYSYLAGNGAPVLSKCAQPILGTLILWNLPLTWKEATP